MNAIVYVDGKSDIEAMNSLLERLIAHKAQEGVSVRFFELPERGNRKEALLVKAPIRAVNIVLNDLAAHVVIMPDLYPPNLGFSHMTWQELEKGICQRFYAELLKRGIKDNRYRERFHAFCFKYEIEALILAAKDAFASRLGVKDLPMTWTNPVENQNHDNPPKRIIADIFREHGERYRETFDLPLILSAGDYETIAEACPQCFKPFVDFLEGL